MVFLAATVLLAGAAWLWTGDPIRAVAVLVVATPCPLILAVPVALVSGISRAAKHGILIKGGKALELIAQIRVLVVDKTGTLTHGRARIVAVRPLADIPSDELLRLAAALDQASAHIIAQTIVAEAHTRGFTLPVPRDVAETPGSGIEGRVEGRHVIVGGLHFVERKLDCPGTLDTPGPAGAVTVARRGRRVHWPASWSWPTNCAPVRRRCCKISGAPGSDASCLRQAIARMLLKPPQPGCR